MSPKFIKFVSQLTDSFTYSNGIYMELSKDDLNMLLKEAYSNNNSTLMKKLLVDLGANPNTLGFTIYDVIAMPTYEVWDVFLREMAEEVPNIELLNVILTDSAFDINSRDETGKTMLMHTMIHGKKDLFNIIMSHPQIDVNIKDNKGLSAFRYVHRNNMELFDILIEHPNLDVNSRDNEGNTILFPTIDVYPNIFRKVLSHPNIDVNAENYHGIRPIDHLSRSHSYCHQTFELILRNDCELSGERLNRVFFNLIAHKHALSCIEKLITYPELDINFEMILESNTRPGWNEYEWYFKGEIPVTPIVMAVVQEHTELVELLLTHPNIDVNWINSNNTMSILNLLDIKFSYTKDSAKKIFLMILAHPSLDFRIKSKDEINVLYYLISRNNFEKSDKEFYDKAIELIFNNPTFDINSTSDEGETILMKSGYVNHGMTIFRLVLNNPKTNVNMQNKKGETALYIAERFRRTQAKNALMKHPNIDPTIKPTP